MGVSKTEDTGQWSLRAACGGEGDVLTIAADPLDLTLCGDCPAVLVADIADNRPLRGNLGRLLRFWG
jgi:hypothetical protein